MDCRQLLEELSNYMDGEATVGLREAIQEHLAFCHKCEVIYNSTRLTLEIVSECCEETFELPREVSDRLHTRLMERLKQDRRFQRP